MFGDRVYIIGSHDKEGGESYCMLDYTFWSAPINDLTDWSCHGVSYSASQDPLYTSKRSYIYAPDMVQGNDGRYYLYYCLAGWRGKGGYDGPISVAVCDTPDGQYSYLGFVKNTDGTPFNSLVCFDPAVINDDGVIRLYFGTGAYRAMTVEPWNSWVLSRVYSKIYNRPAKEFKQKTSPLGANSVSLKSDMMTLNDKAQRILPDRAKHTAFEGHAFFEGSSIRKIGSTYYFIYSSQNNHELCYATSRFPDKDFCYRGVIVSNGDVGINGKKEKARANATGTTHGCIECINGQWYVFYHRLTHGTDYSRQICAEKIFIRSDGSIEQAEMTSCGLNKTELSGKGAYPAIICCNLTNGHMPHIANNTCKNIPMVTHDGDERFISGASGNTNIIYRYFDLRSTK